MIQNYVIHITKKIKPPKILGGFFIYLFFIFFSIFASNSIFANSNKNISIWITTNSKIECKKLLENNAASIKYYSNWLSSFFVKINYDKLEEIKKSKYILSVQYATSLYIPDLEYKDVDLSKQLMDNNNYWFEYFNDNYYKQYLQSKQINILNYLNLNNLPKVKIGIIDGGFDTHSSFFDNINIVKHRNFTDEKEDNGEFDNHGTSVLGLIGGNEKGTVKTSGENCDFYLAKTEVSSSEKLVEEYNLVHALEWMVDTLNVKFINISLGYSTFDNHNDDHTVGEFNGDSTIAAKAVNEAYKRGASIFVAAGNEAEKSWKYITTPADAYGALTVGAVDENEERAYFSSFGIDSFAIKPDIMDFGQDVSIFNNVSNDINSISSGTSLASPIALGTAILLKRLNPNITNNKIYDRLKKSGNNSTTPNHEYGYGVLNSLKVISDSTTLCGFVYKTNGYPINNCKVIINSDSVYTKSDGFWFYKNSSKVQTLNSVSYIKNGYKNIIVDLIAGTIDSVVLKQNNGNIKISFNSPVRKIAQYKIFGKNFSYLDKSDYNSEYNLDTNNIKTITQKIIFGNDTNTTILTSPFSDTTINIELSTNYARLSFASGNILSYKFIKDLYITVTSQLGNFNYTTDNYGSILISSNEVGENFSIHTDKMYSGFNRSYNLTNNIDDTLYSSINPTIYPNPLIKTKNGSTIYINYDNLSTENSIPSDFVKVFTSLGKQISNLPIDYNVDKNRFEIKTDKLAYGIYFFKVKDKTFKLLIIK